ncbi:MAG: polysaccharide deacetylase family protein [Wolbachia endosymbiont of Menacanthus eurysternus]|nr:MAG: polysaccharide deacetylase family protein [Wolbachia endosymbiont of Menacanthus eurysternus]
MKNTGLKKWVVMIFIFLYPTTIVFSSCNFNLSYRGLSCDLDLSYKNLNDIKKLLNKNDKFVALTFDDGPSNNKISDIFSILEKYKIKVTFFLLGKYINENTSKILRIIHGAGHELGNHSWSHRKLIFLSRKEQLQELEKTSMKIKNITKQNVKWFRPPYGCYNDSLIENINLLDMHSILWTVDSLDWRGDEPEVLIERVVNNMHNGAIVLFHDHNNKSNTIKALPQIIKILKKLGYKFVTLSEWEDKVCDVMRTKNILNKNTQS